MKKNILILMILFKSTITFSQTNEDIFLITEARVALKNYDYRTALLSLDKVSSAGKQMDLYFLYSAQAYEGKGDIRESLYNYEEYSKKHSLTSELAEKIATLRYQLRKKNADADERQLRRIKNLSGNYKVVSYFPYAELSGTTMRLVQNGIDIEVYDVDDNLVFVGKHNGEDITSLSYFYLHYTFCMTDQCDGCAKGLIKVNVKDNGETLELIIPKIKCEYDRSSRTYGYNYYSDQAVSYDLTRK